MSFRARLSAVLTIAIALACSAFATTALAAAPAWQPVAATGPTVLPVTQSEVQHLAVNAEGGTYTLTVGGQSTSPLAFDADADVVEAALNGLSTIAGTGGNVRVTGGPGGAGAEHPYAISFGGTMADQDVPQISVDASLTGASAPYASIATAVPGGPGTSTLALYLQNIGGGESSGAISYSVDLPSGVTLAAAPDGGGFTGWTCSGAPGAEQFSCTSSAFMPPVQANSIAPQITATITSSSGGGTGAVHVEATGGGAALSTFDLPLTVGATPAGPGIQSFVGGAYNSNGKKDTRAGAHPYSASTAIFFNTRRSAKGDVVPSGEPKDIKVDLPTGFVGNPTATPQCPESTQIEHCDLDTIVGLVQPIIQEFASRSEVDPVVNTEVPYGAPAQFRFLGLHLIPLGVVGSLRSDGDYGVTAASMSTPQLSQLYGAFFTFWGVPADPSHDSTRCKTTINPQATICGASDAPNVPLLTNPTNCAGEAIMPPVTNLNLTTWQSAEEIFTSSIDIPPVTECEKLEFDSELDFQPSEAKSATPVAFQTNLTVPSGGLTDGSKRITPEIKDTVLRLPKGVILNAAAADGLKACSLQQIGFKGGGFPMPNPMRFDKNANTCPEASKIGTGKLETPLLEEPLHGALYLAAQGDGNPFGSIFAVYLVIEEPRYGIFVKLPGRVDPDLETGQMTVTFQNLPQLPFARLDLRLKDGSRSALANPDTCGQYVTHSELTPWSAPQSGPPLVVTDSFTIDQGVNGGPCASTLEQRPLDVGFDAGSTDPVGGGHSSFVARFTRGDGNQELDRIDVTTPEGLLANLSQVPYCPEAAIAAAVARDKAGDGAAEVVGPSCPEVSRVGATTIGAGTGPTPFYPTGGPGGSSGAVYLAGPYRGAPLSLVFAVPAVAGPFDLGVQVVRVALNVDRRTAQVTAVSDAIPKILEGVPLRIKDIRINIDRRDFILNPSSCAAKQVASRVSGASGATTTLGSPFRVGGCARLPFKPKLALSLIGKKQTTTGRHPGIKAKVTQTGVGEAGIEKAVVRLPKSLALDPDNAQALCEFADGTKPDLENHCPKGSIVGRARAKTPLLKDDLVGNVYFVKNIRIDKKTGNQIRTLPMIIVALRGEIAINLIGTSSTTKAGKLVNTFANVPDAPISQFNLNIQGGGNGIIAVTRTRKAKINLCTGRHIAEADMDGQNGRRHDFDVRMKTPCTKRQVKRAKRAAAKARAGSKRR